MTALAVQDLQKTIGYRTGRAKAASRLASTVLGLISVLPFLSGEKP